LLLSLVSKMPKDSLNLTKATSYCLDLTFHMPIEKSCSKSKRTAKLTNAIEHAQKPDVDNLCKFFLDCANGILYRDDCMITHIICKKYWSDNPRTEVVIIPKIKNQEPI